MIIKDKFIIPEKSIIHFELRGVSYNDLIKTVESYNDMEVLGDSLIIIDDGLYCTDSIKPVERIKENEFKIIIWLQDAYLVKESYLYSSISEGI